MNKSKTVFQDFVPSIVSTIAGVARSAGYLDGPTNSSLFNNPYGVAIDPFNGNIIVSDSANNVIRLIDITSNNVSTLAGVDGGGGYQDGPTNSSLFSFPIGVAIDPFNGNVFVADYYNSVIRLINITSNNVSTFAGGLGAGYSGYQDGPINSALFSYPYAVAIDPFNGNIIVADTGNNVIRLINITSNNVSTLAGVLGAGAAGYQDGPTTSALFNIPYGVAIDPFNGNVFVADTSNQVIRLINITSNNVSTLSGVAGIAGFLDGPETSALFNYPYGVAIDPSNGNIMVVDHGNSMIRLIDISMNNVSTLAGNGSAGYVNGNGDLAELNHPNGVAIDPLNGNIIVVDSGNNVIRSICSEETYYIDSDSDGFGSTTSTLLFCQSTALIGLSRNSLDCNDQVSYIHPGQQEICNSIDDNCNDLTDEGVKTTYYEDMNGKLELNITVQACSPPPGYVMFSSSLLGQPSQQQQLHSSNHQQQLHSSNHQQQHQNSSTNLNQNSVNSANRLQGFICGGGKRLGAIGFKAIHLLVFFLFSFFF